MMDNPSGKFYFNGKAYETLEELPEEARQFFKDGNQNGLPDFMENILGGKLAEIMKNPIFQKYGIQDKIRDQMQHMTPEVQQRVKQNLERLNLFFNAGGTSQSPSAPTMTPPTFQAPPLDSATFPILQAPSLGSSLQGLPSPVKTGSSGNLFYLLVVAIGIFILGMVVALWQFHK